MFEYCTREPGNILSFGSDQEKPLTLAELKKTTTTITKETKKKKKKQKQVNSKKISPSDIETL